MRQRESSVQQNDETETTSSEAKRDGGYLECRRAESVIYVMGGWIVGWWCQ